MTADVRFWNAENPADTIFSNIRQIRQISSDRRQMWLYAACLYDDPSNGYSFDPTGFTSNSELSVDLTLNVIRPTVDMFTTQITKARPLPQALTNSGKFVQQRRAKKLSKFIEGLFSELRVWETNTKIVQHAANYGTGFGYAYRVGDQIHYEHVFGNEVDVDPRDAIYGSPRTIYITRHVDRQVVLEQFPDKEEQIKNAIDLTEDYLLSTALSTADQITIIEAWHLPSGPDADDGKHMIVTSNEVLFEEEYNYQRLPIFPLHVAPPSVGYFGTGFAKLLQGVQYTMNIMTSRCQRQAMMAPAIVLNPNGSGVDPEDIDNDDGLPILGYNPGLQPTMWQPAPFNGEYWSFVQSLYQFAFDQVGISQAMAEAELPKGIRDVTGAALREMSESRSERFFVASRSYEQFNVDLAWRFIDLAEEILAEGGTVKTVATSKRGGTKLLEALDFKKIRMERDAFTLEIYAGSALKEEPVSRMAIIESGVNSGLIPPERAPSLMSFPDTAAYVERNQAKFDYIDYLLEKILDPDVKLEDAVKVIPTSVYPLEYSLLAGLEFYYLSGLHEEDEERRQLLLDWVTQTQELLKRAGMPWDPNEQKKEPVPGTPALTPQGAPTLEGMPAPTAAPPTPGVSAGELAAAVAAGPTGQMPQI
jgi:hypothetical protein